MSEQSERLMREARSRANWCGGVYSDNPIRRHEVNEMCKVQALFNAYTGRGHISPEAFCYPGFPTSQLDALESEITNV